MEINFLALLVAAISTLVVGFIWYNPKVFGTIWMKESGMTEEKMKGANALYERRSFKYTLVTGGFWIVCCMIMGGIICAWK